MNGSLIVVGTGIGSAGQISLEARNAIIKADVVYHRIPDPLTIRLIEELNSNSHTLVDLYETKKSRALTYEEMSDRVIESVRAAKKVCAVFYGHPGVFVDPSHKAIATLRKEGFYTRMLPGVSAEDCLFADLGIDPGRTGLQTYEATLFLTYPPKFDTRIPTIIWQVGAIGVVDNDLTMRASKPGLQVLSDELAKHYGANHEVVVYEASLLGICDPRIDRVQVDELPNCFVSSASTLFVPAHGKLERSDEVVGKLGLTETLSAR